jgi:dTDP-4-amino-4,6-dideoxygalactose transaminase
MNTNVTQPFMPPLEEFQPYLEEIWQSKWLTNNGRFHQQLESELCNYLGVKHLCLFSNATLALITAIQALKITGEVITTPFSFVATTHSLWWNNIKPVFVDIEPDFLNLNPEKIEAALTPKTTAILPVHVYGNPCKVEAIQKIAETYGLHVMYDAAHAFGTKINHHSILNYGELSVLSFHATKVYNTFEGGAIVCHDEKMKLRIDRLKNFGFANETTVVAPGINAKMNEIQAAFGLLQLKYVDQIIEKRKVISDTYRNRLANIKGIKLIPEPPNTTTPYSYFPILITPEYAKSRDEVYTLYREHHIFVRRYFYPLISEFPTYRGLPSADPANLPVANKIAKEVLCLPIYPDLQLNEVEKICSLLEA